jgi:UrcA family protein
VEIQAGVYMRNSAKWMIGATALVLAGTCQVNAGTTWSENTEAVVVTPSSGTVDGINSEVNSVVLRFGDLNSPAGVATLYRRINVAAANVCGVEQLTGTFAVSPYWKRCVAQAVDGAVTQVGRPDMTAYHLQHVGDQSQRAYMR